MSEIDWIAKADCADKDPEMFFNPYSVQEAIDVCNKCPVQEQCLTYALDGGLDWGVWGGLPEEERRSINRKRRLASQVGTVATEIAS